MKQLKGADKSELYSFIEKSLEDIFHAAEQSRSEVGPVEFSLAVTEIKEAGGGISSSLLTQQGNIKGRKSQLLGLQYGQQRMPLHISECYEQRNEIL